MALRTSSPTLPSQANQTAAEINTSDGGNAGRPTSPVQADLKKTHTAEATRPGDNDNTSPTNLTVIQLVRKWPKVSGWVLALTTGIVLSGFDISIISNVASLPEFQYAFGQPFGDMHIIPALWLGLWNTAVPLGAILGAISGGILQDALGRRFSIGLAAVVTFLCVGASYASDLSPSLDTRRGIFLLAKTVQGGANGMMLCAMETYMSEVLPPELRGPGLALYPIFTLVGQLVGSLVVQGVLSIPGPRSYRIAFATQWPFAFFPLVVSVFIPESPAWLVRLNRISTARKNFSRLNNAPTLEKTEQSFQDLRRTVQLENETAENRSVGYSECFRGPVDTRRTLIAMLVRLVPMFFGLPLFATAAYFLQTIGISARVSVLFILVGVVLGLLSNVVSFWTLTTFGRRPLLLVSLSIAAVLWTSVGIAGCFTGSAMQWYVSIAMMVTLATVAVAAWLAAHVAAVESSSLRLRARTSTLR